jgi:DNA-directed RNA polymerase specialized sigma24 family protein
MAEKARLVDALETKEGEDSDFATWMLGRLNSPPESENAPGSSLDLDDMLDVLQTDEDRTIVRLWATGSNHVQIAAHLGLSETAIRQRWSRIRLVLQEGLSEFQT